MGLTGQYCTGQAQQQYQNTLNNATHTPRIYNVVYGQGGWTSGSPVPPSGNAFYQQTQDSGPIATVDLGAPFAMAEGGDILCSLVGEIWKLVVTSQGEIATTWSVQNGPAYGCIGSDCYRPLANWCDTAHTPPDFSPPWIFGTGVTTASYFVGSAFCLRGGPGQTRHCGPGAGEPLPSAIPPQACTKTP
jgi:hypothetical protein